LLLSFREVKWVRVCNGYSVIGGDLW